MTKAHLSDLQGRILDACKAAEMAASRRMPTDRELADVAGVDASLVCRWRSGSREVGLAELDRLASRFGAAAVYAPLMARHEAPAAAVLLTTARSASVRATATMAGFSASLEEALTDGQLTEEEVEGLEMQAAQAEAQLRRALQAVTNRRRSA